MFYKENLGFLLANHNIFLVEQTAPVCYHIRCVGINPEYYRGWQLQSSDTVLQAVFGLIKKYIGVKTTSRYQNAIHYVRNCVCLQPIIYKVIVENEGHKATFSHY